MEMPASTSVRSIERLPDSRASLTPVASWKSNESNIQKEKPEEAGFLDMWRELARFEDGKRDVIEAVDMVFAYNDQEQLTSFTPIRRTMEKGVPGITGEVLVQGYEAISYTVHVAYDQESGELTWNELTAPDIDQEQVA